MIRAGSRASAGSMGMTQGWYAGSWKSWQIRLEMTYIEGGSGVDGRSRAARAVEGVEIAIAGGKEPLLVPIWGQVLAGKTWTRGSTPSVSEEWAHGAAGTP